MKLPRKFFISGLVLVSSLSMAETKSDPADYIKCLRSLESAEKISAPVGNLRHAYTAFPSVRSGSFGVYIVTENSVGFVASNEVALTSVVTIGSRRDRLRFMLDTPNGSVGATMNLDRLEREGRTTLVKGFTSEQSYPYHARFTEVWDVESELNFQTYLQTELAFAQSDYLKGKRDSASLNAHLDLLKSCKIVDGADKLEKDARKKSSAIFKIIRR